MRKKLLAGFVVAILVFGVTAVVLHPEPRFSRQNFDRVTSGMSTNEVLEILGQPRSVERIRLEWPIPGVERVDDWEYSYFAGLRTAGIWFTNGAVMATDSNGLVW